MEVAAYEVEKTNSMKLRFLIMGCVISALCAGLLIARGFATDLAALTVVGLVLLGLGLVWR